MTPECLACCEKGRKWSPFITKYVWLTERKQWTQPQCLPVEQRSSNGVQCSHQRWRAGRFYKTGKCLCIAGGDGGGVGSRSHSGRVHYEPVAGAGYTCSRRLRAKAGMWMGVISGWRDYRRSPFSSLGFCIFPITYHKHAFHLFTVLLKLSQKNWPQ